MLERVVTEGVTSRTATAERWLEGTAEETDET
jgi:hypothetical protein